MAIETRHNLYFYGSALSNDRCIHYVKLCEYALSHFSAEYTYSELRECAERDHILSNDAIRTLIPIFKGLGFVSYERLGNFAFQDDGLVFYHIQKALSAAQDLSDTCRNAILPILEDAKTKLIWKGLIHLYKLDDDNSRKFQIAIQLLNHFRDISIQEYLYAIYYSLENETIDFSSIIDAVTQRRRNNETDDVLSWNSRAEKYELTKDTATSYLKDLLRTSSLISDSDSSKIVASDQFATFISLIN